MVSLAFTALLMLASFLGLGLQPADSIGGPGKTAVQPADSIGGPGKTGAPVTSGTVVTNYDSIGGPGR